MSLITFNSYNSGWPPPAPLRFFFGYLFPWPFILAGFITIYCGLSDLSKAQSSSSWAQVPGVITSSKIQWTSDDHGSSATANVIYTYTVLGLPHTCNKVFYGDYGSSDSSHADGIVSQYSPGQSVTVYCDPVNPSFAVLQPGIHSSCYFLPAFGSVFLIIGLLMYGYLPMLLNRPVVPPADSTPSLS